MKIQFVLVFSILTLNINAQNKFEGRYYNFFGGHITINPDSTFKYEFHLDLEASWTKGVWTVNRDTIYFRMIPVFDTLQYIDKKGVSHDSLLLSLDETPNEITLEEAKGLYSYGQERHSSPKKLFYKNNKLYGIGSDGKLVTKKMKGSWTRKKFVPWFIKSHEKRDAQSSLPGNYNTTIDLSDSIEHVIRLDLKADMTYNMPSPLMTSWGKWKETRNKIKLKPKYFTLGCFIQKNKTIKLYKEKGKLILDSKPKINKKRTERELSKGAGEKVNLEVHDSNSIVFQKKINKVITLSTCCIIFCQL
jgi:hypothetical protein